jgi:hypothetical protein
MPCFSRLRSNALQAVVAFAAVSFLACSPARLGDGRDDPTGENTGEEGSPCDGSERSCQGNNLLSCEAGVYKKTMSCAATQRCDAALGCVTCLPKNGQLCVGDSVHRCNPDGSVGIEIEKCQVGQCQVGRCSTMCTVAGTDLIYVVDADYRLLSFNPRDGKYEYKLIGELKCPAGTSIGGGQATPFSMSVDRKGQAWVLYSSGEIFNVSTQNAACTRTTFKPRQSGFEVFGMGFVSDAAGSDKETLFIAGGKYDQLRSGDLGRIDTAALTLQKIGALQINGQSSPELTGTGNGEAYGYFPGSSAFVAQIDKSTAMNLRTWNLDPISGGGSPRAWAFAHWGGRFYIFITVVSGSERSWVIELDPATGKNKVVTTNASYKIVGAGVSTCAPVIIG